VKKPGGRIWILAGTLLAVVAGALAFWVIYRASSQATPTVEPVAKSKVVVAARGIAIRELIQEGDVQMRSVPVDIIPESAIRDMDEAVGFLAVSRIVAGEIILASDVLSPTLKGANLALVMDETQVAIAFPADDLMSSNNLLQPGDHVDLLFTIETALSEESENELVTFVALQNVEIASIIQPTDPEGKVTSPRPFGLVFALDPQDALVLKHLRDTGGRVDIVLRAPGVDERFVLQPVNAEYLIYRYELRIPVLP